MKNKIGRFLVVYDGDTEEVSELIALDNVDLDTLKDLLDVPPTDPEMHDRYVVGPDEFEQISSYFPEKVEPDFSQNAYFVEAIVEDLQ